MPTKQKEQQVDLLKEKFSSARSIIVADHTGINVNDLTVLRRDLRKSNSEFRVAKNTLLKIAAGKAGLDDMVGFFDGPTSMVFGFDDPSVSARIIHEFWKKTDKPTIKAYCLENKLLTVEDFEKIAKLPPRDELLAQLLGSVQGPVVIFVMTLDGVIRNFIGLVDALAEKKK
jgi:large subunit ribosomal protein L10